MADSILRLPAVKTRTGLSRSTIYLRVSQGRFFRPVSLGGRAVGWVEEEIQSWLAERECSLSSRPLQSRALNRAGGVARLDFETPAHAAILWARASLSRSR